MSSINDIFWSIGIELVKTGKFGGYTWMHSLFGNDKIYEILILVSYILMTHIGRFLVALFYIFTTCIFGSFEQEY